MSSASDHTTDDLPVGKITVCGGRVQKVEKWAYRPNNGEPFLSVEIGRTVGDPEGEFFSRIGDPEHGGSFKRGTLDEVISGLHPRTRGKYITLFSFEKVTKIIAQAAGFSDYELEDQTTAIA